jgi:hypothetical protein
MAGHGGMWLVGLSGQAWRPPSPDPGFWEGVRNRTFGVGVCWWGVGEGLAGASAGWGPPPAAAVALGARARPRHCPLLRTTSQRLESALTLPLCVMLFAVLEAGAVFNPRGVDFSSSFPDLERVKNCKSVEKLRAALLHSVRLGHVRDRNIIDQQRSFKKLAPLAGLYNMASELSGDLQLLVSDFKKYADYAAGAANSGEAGDIGGSQGPGGSDACSAAPSVVVKAERIQGSSFLAVGPGLAGQGPTLSFFHFEGGGSSCMPSLASKVQVKLASCCCHAMARVVYRAIVR